MTWNYYNECDPHAAAWLKALMARGLIPLGDVDTRSIVEVMPDDLQGYTQCHFFAGIGGWSLALQLAGWPATRHVWTGSCPCQPFSVAGKRKGTADERHLWPEFARLIGECKPATVFGEQVASKDGREWLNGVLLDLERLGYAGAGADLCAACEGAPHIRQRLFWVPYAGIQRREDGPPIQRGNGAIWATKGPSKLSTKDSETGSGLRHAVQPGLEGHAGNGHHGHEPGRLDPQEERPATTTSFWSDYDIIQFQDGKARRIESGLEPLAHGVSGFVAVGSGGRAKQALAWYHRATALKGFGNAIVPQLGASFIEASEEAKASILETQNDYR
jgi:DNA (cytosine-5)-methyltransferase 1